MSLVYCKKCGRLVQDIDKCDCCKSQTFKVPKEFLISDTVPLIKNSLEEQFINDYVKTSPEFDQYLFDHRDEILAKQSAEFNAKMAIGKAIVEEQSRVPKCPSCGSANVSKIGVVNRVVSTHFLGLGSSKIGKTHKCNKCGTTW